MEQHVQWGWMRLRRNDGCQLLIQELFGIVEEEENDDAIIEQREDDVGTTHSTGSIAALLLSSSSTSSSSEDVVEIGLDELLLIASLKIVKDKHLPLGERYAARQYYTNLLRQHTNRWISFIQKFECDDAAIACCRLPIIQAFDDHHHHHLEQHHYLTMTKDNKDALFDKAASLFDLAHLYSDRNNFVMAHNYFQRCLKVSKSTLGIYHPDTAHVYRGIGISNFRNQMINLRRRRLTSSSNTNNNQIRYYNEVYESPQNNDDDDTVYEVMKHDYIVSNISNILDPFVMDVKIKMYLKFDYQTKYSYGQICHLLSKHVRLSKTQIQTYFVELERYVQQQQQREKKDDDGNNNMGDNHHIHDMKREEEEDDDDEQRQDRESDEVDEQRQ